MSPSAHTRHKQLAAEGISTSIDLALWARRRGLLSVFLQFISLPSSREAYWQVVRPGYETDASDTAHSGNKTFPATGVPERILSLQEALIWLSLTYGVEKWVSVAGFPNTLFPIDTAKELREVCPSVLVSNDRGRLVLSKSL